MVLVQASDSRAVDGEDPVGRGGSLTGKTVGIFVGIEAKSSTFNVAVTIAYDLS
jgi:hypothetical protein